MTRSALKTLGLIRVAFITGIGFLMMSPVSARAQGPATAAAAATPGPGGTEVTAERVIVTGSNIPTAEEVGPNPVDTYRRDDITRLGARTPTDLIQRIPAATGFSINQNNTNGGDGSTRVDLRGIDPKETLILEDGRRLADVGFAGTSPDFNSFPFGLIDHIDILKDGASPIYGTDAVSGVVNVYLIHKFRGLETYASYGNTSAGFANDMGQESAYVLAGTGDDKTNIVVYAGMFNQDALYSRDVNVSHDADFRLEGGQDFRSSNFAGLVGSQQFAPRFNTFAAGLRTPTPHAFANASSDPQYQNTSNVGLLPGQRPLPSEQLFFNFADTTPDVAATDREYLYGSFDRDLCDKYLTVFADFRYFRQFWDGAAAPTPFSPDVWTDVNNPFGISSAGISVPTQNAFNPFTVADYVSPGGVNPAFPQTRASAAPPGTAFTTGVSYRSLEAGLRTDKIQTENYLFTGGLKGNLGEFAGVWDKLKTWEWETGIRWNEDYRVERAGGLVNNNALRTALLDTNPATAFNPFGLNQNTKAVINSVFITTNHIGWTTLLTEDFRLNGDMFDLPGGPISFATGTEHLTNKTSDNPDALTSSGQTTGNVNFAPTRGSRDSWSQYWEVRIPVTGQTWNFPGFHSLEFDYAERFEDFSDFGQTERPKFSVRWQPIDSALTLRAAYIEAFHAPALGELFSGASQSFPAISDPLGLSQAQVEQILLGNPSLKPEISYEYTYGGVITPGKWWSALQGLTLSADLVHIDLRGFTTTIDPQFVVDHTFGGTGQPIFPTFFAGLGATGASSTTFVERLGTPLAPGGIQLINTPFVNTGREIISAWDYEAVEIFETSRLGHGDWGTFTGTFNGTYNADIDVQIVPNGPRFTAVGKFGGGFQGVNGGGAYTHNRWYASLFYDGPTGTWMQGIDTGAVVHYVGQYWDNEQFTFFNNKPRNPTAPPADQIPIGSLDRKVSEWTTVDLILNYTFNLPSPVPQTEVPGLAKDGGKNVKIDGKENNVMPVSTAEFNPCGWRAWLNNTTITIGVDNVMDLEPPFVAAAFENGFDEVTTNPLGRFCYIAVKKNF